MKHKFTEKILNIIEKHFKSNSEQIFSNSELLKYLNFKTISVNQGSKSRGSFANIYAIYVLVEDYLNNNFQKNNNYADYEGAKFSDLFTRQRELPFGSKLQNHALNHRLNQEFKKHFPTCNYIPIIRIVETQRYWINENLLKVKINKKVFNIAEVLINIIDEYIKAKQEAFLQFINTSKKLRSIENKSPEKVKEFIVSLLEPNVDARIFEIVSFSILKFYYKNQSVFWGWSIETIAEEDLKLFKTGRTNANDGGIDFVMKPLGRFFQVTETTDVKKYFLDIDKLEKYPVTFVVKSNESVEKLLNKIREGAIEQYQIKKVVEKYMNSIEKIINLDVLIENLEQVEENKKLKDVLDEIIKQSKIEFNIDD